jgi:hypothetical protein
VNASTFAKKDTALFCPIILGHKTPKFLKSLSVDVENFRARDQQGPWRRGV